jgi:hypothetical protein
MSPKSKKKRSRRNPLKRHEDMFGRVKSSLPGVKFLVEPEGEVKMSDVLKAFVEPYMDTAETEDALRKLLSLALIAWNASFLPEPDRHAMIDRAVDISIKPGYEDMKRELQAIVNELIDRKLAYFYKYTRTMLDFELTATERGYHLSVISTLGKA